MRLFHSRKLVVAGLLLAVLCCTGCSTPIHKWPGRIAHELQPHRLDKFNEQVDPFRDDYVD